MDIEEILRQLRNSKAFVTVASAEEKQALMDLCSKYWKPATGCNARSWKRFPHLISYRSDPTFAGKSAEALIAEGKVQYLFKDLIEQPIVIDTSDLL